MVSLLGRAGLKLNATAAKVKISPKEEAAFYATRYTRNWDIVVLDSSAEHTSV